METVELNVPQYLANDGDGINKDIFNIIKKYKLLEDQRNTLQKENGLLRSDRYKDVVITKYKEKYEEVRDKLSRGFGISKEEQEKINKWMETHECKYRKLGLSRISEYKFTIIPGIGYNGYIMCECGNQFCFYEE